MKYLSLILLLLLVCGCKDMASFDYSPFKDIELQFNLKRAKYSQEHKATFLYFELQVKNDASEDIYFDPGRLKVNVNGTISKETYYDSLASVMPERKILKKCKDRYNLYFVLTGETKLKSIEEFKVLNFGLDQGETPSQS